MSEKWLEWRCGCWWEYYDEYPCRLHVCQEHQKKYGCSSVLRVEIFGESKLIEEIRKELKKIGYKD
ncbi:MAG: hypothetical protein B5M53_12170 [Candidatus Cloacimonas sp. 4484_209]|nr:MAG: hypothetical protein B5M53_12170 [Candidatus Cloacimonas sp. 4484_209]